MKFQLLIADNLAEKMLKNAYLLAKIGADTAENEQHFAEILPIGRRVTAAGGDVLDPATVRSAAVALRLDQRVVQVALQGHTWGICTRRAGRLYKDRSRLYRSQNSQEHSKYSCESSR